MGIFKGAITGKLISRIDAAGTLSEGPIYFILPTGEFKKWREIHVGKKTMRWMKDPVLHDLIGEIITINGEIIETKNTITIDYDEVVHNGKTIPALPQKEEKVLTSEELEERIRKLL